VFGINKKNIFDFVEDTITINKDNPLKEGIDFEIVPIDVITDDFDVYTDNYILLKKSIISNMMATILFVSRI
jgi:hypothetical protein